MPLARRLAKELLPDWIEHNLKYKVRGALQNLRQDDSEQSWKVLQSGRSGEIPGRVWAEQRSEGRGCSGFEAVSDDRASAGGTLAGSCDAWYLFGGVFRAVPAIRLVAPVKASC